jgi:hypothetical protein
VVVVVVVVVVVGVVVVVVVVVVAAQGFGHLHRAGGTALSRQPGSGNLTWQQGTGGCTGGNKGMETVPGWSLRLG